MKYLILLTLLIGCSKKDIIQDNIDVFTRECGELAECMERAYKVKVNLHSESLPLTCSIKFSEFTTAHLYTVPSFNIEEGQTFQHFFESDIRVCRMLKKRGDYSKLNQNAMHRYSECIKLDQDSKEHTKKCWEQYRNGEFYDAPDVNEYFQCNNHSPRHFAINMQTIKSKSKEHGCEGWEYKVKK